MEGTQGFGLSLYHSHSYPRCTSRDTTAAGFLSEVGLSPLLVTEIVVVFRTFPIRVSGEQAGPLKDEITWELIQRESGYPYPIAEMTTVSKKVRRVGRFDWELARRAIRYNKPTMLALNGLDYITYQNSNARDWENLCEPSRKLTRRLEDEAHVPVSMMGIGPRVTNVIAPSGILIETISAPLEA